MRITIYYDNEGKAKQVINPFKNPECTAESIVNTVTKGDYHYFKVDKSK